MSALHITNGDAAAETLRAFLSDPVVTACDVLHDGPAPAVDGDAWHEVRARYLSAGFDAEFEATRASLAATDRAIADFARHDEVTLWFEHDLFDQLQIIRTLAIIGGADKPRPRDGQVTLICIDRFPGVDRFIGLGQLDAGQLASLFPARRAVTGAQYAVASAAWDAFRAPDPSMLAELWQTGPLPFLRAALRRLMEEYPSTTIGLSRTREAILRTLAARGPLDAFALFRATQALEERPFMGDLGFFDNVRTLAGARVPLVAIAPGDDRADLHGRAIRLTEAGHDVVAGRSDAVELNGIDEWRGGVRLLGANRSPWRWDITRETLISCS